MSKLVEEIETGKMLKKKYLNHKIDRENNKKHKNFPKNSTKRF